MRRRSTVTVWPAFADLMTVLAVVGFTSAVGLAHEQKERRESAAEAAALRESLASAERSLGELETMLAKAESQLEAARRASAEQAQAHLAQVQALEQLVVRNRRLLNATEEVQRIIERIGRDDVIQFGVDQSVHFGDDLVRFPLNGMEPVWTADGRQKLREFCTRLAAALGPSSKEKGGREFPFVLQVEGHTDNTTCHRDPHCNWRFAVGRAVRFAELMREDDNCPAAKTLELLPVGYADTRPLPSGALTVAVRRVSLRLLPDYRRLLEET